MSDKPFMYAAGKSDRPIVPAKAPNKEDRHSAEGLEGSGLIEENAARSHTGRTPRRKAVFQGLDGVRRTASDSTLSSEIRAVCGKAARTDLRGVVSRRRESVMLYER